MKLYPLAFHELLLEYDIYNFVNIYINTLALDQLLTDIDTFSEDNVQCDMDEDIFLW